MAPKHREQHVASNAQRTFDAVRALDLELLLSIYSETITIEEDPSLPYGGTFEGTAGAYEHSILFAQTWTDRQTNEQRDPREQIFVSGSTALASWQLRAGVGAKELSVYAVSRLDFGETGLEHLRMHYADTRAIIDFIRTTAR
jgi:hypothetical protein